MAVASKYHINPETGRPNKCSATVRGCKYSKDDMIPEHYDSKEDAQKAYEQKMEQKQGSTTKINKSLKKNVKTSQRNKKINSLKDDQTLDTNDPYDISEWNEYLDRMEEDERNNRSLVETSVEPDETEEEGYYDYLDNYPAGRGFKNIKDNHNYTVSEAKYEEIYSEYNHGLGGTYYRATLNIYDYGSNYPVRVNDGTTEYISPDEPYHESDVSYVEDPSFEILDKKGFVEEVVVNEVKKNKNSETTVKEVNDRLLNKLENIGFFNEGNYEANITGGYYGQEFNGFNLDNDVKEKAVQVFVEEALDQEREYNEEYGN